jgi:hypothetical protein
VPEGCVAKRGEINPELCLGFFIFKPCAFAGLFLFWGVIMVVKALRMVVVATAWMMLSFSAAHAETTIDLQAIKTIESGGDPYAVNVETGCYGLYQISEICLKDYNQLHSSHYIIKDLFRPEINEMIASWYFGRIREMLASYEIPINLTTVIASYNWGIGRVAVWANKGMRFEELPAETRHYIKKYRTLTRPA